jgi:hypothetical protein
MSKRFSKQAVLDMLEAKKRGHTHVALSCRDKNRARDAKIKAELLQGLIDQLKEKTAVDLIIVGED